MGTPPYFASNSAVTVTYSDLSQEVLRNFK